MTVMGCQSLQNGRRQIIPYIISSVEWLKAHLNEESMLVGVHEVTDEQMLTDDPIRPVKTEW